MRLTMLPLIVGALAGLGCAGGGAADAGNQAKCSAIRQSWLDLMGKVDHTCAAASDCIIPYDCRCGDPPSYSALGASLHDPVNMRAYQSSLAYPLTGQYVDECLHSGPHLMDCGERQLACAGGTCTIASRENCMIECTSNSGCEAGYGKGWYCASGICSQQPPDAGTSDAGE